MHKLKLTDQWQKDMYAVIRAMNFIYRVRHNGRIKFRIPRKHRNNDNTTIHQQPN